MAADKKSKKLDKTDKATDKQTALEMRSSKLKSSTAQVPLCAWVRTST